MIRIIFLILFLVSSATAQPILVPDVGANDANVFTKEQTIDLNTSNYLPGTTRHLKLKNSGSYSWLDFIFGSTTKSAIGADNNGNLYDYITSGRCRYLYSLNYSQFIAECGGGYDHYYGYIAGNGGVRAGGNGSPSSTLEVTGSSEFGTVIISNSQTLSTAATYIFCNPSSNVCTGTPSNLCSSYSNSTDCLARESHGGCVYITYDCSPYNYDISACQSNSGNGCYPAESSCGGASDQSSCENQDDAYGGSCIWNNSPVSCNGFDEESCSSYYGCYPSTATCSNNFYDCSVYNGDETGCGDHSADGCYYDSGSCLGGNWVSCSGGGSCGSQPDQSSCEMTSYFVSCDGSYDNYSCDGNYYTGSCGGGNSSCTGSPSCGGITNSTNCGNEPGCAYTSGLNLTLPALNSSVEGRTYSFINISSTNADCILLPNTAQDINGSSSLNLNDQHDSVTLIYKELTASCSQYDNNQSSCESHPPCSFSGCSQYGDETSCIESSYSCNWNGSNCEGSNGLCSGTMITARRWFNPNKGY